jgi:hypothetical protein
MNATEIFGQIKAFVDFNDADVQTLSELSPWVEAHGPAITDLFYETIGSTEAVASYVEGRIEHLKKTHIQWMKELVGGEYGDAYFESRWKIGEAHVRIGLEPIWVDGTMSLIRSHALASLADNLEDKTKVANATKSLIKACDLDLAIINLAYAEDRLERLSSFTGMKRALIENVIKLPKKD